MTDQNQSIDTTPEAIDRVIAGLRPMNGSNEMDAGVAMIEALSGNLSRTIDQSIDSLEMQEKFWADTCKRLLDRAEKAEALLKEISEKLAESNYDIDRNIK